MTQSPWEANSYSASQNNLSNFVAGGCPLLFSQQPSIDQYPEPYNSSPNLPSVFLSQTGFRWGCMYLYQFHFNVIHGGLVFKVNGSSYITAFYAVDMPIGLFALITPLEYTTIITLPWPVGICMKDESLLSCLSKRDFNWSSIYRNFNFLSSIYMSFNLLSNIYMNFNFLSTVYMNFNLLISIYINFNLLSSIYMNFNLLSSM